DGAAIARTSVHPPRPAADQTLVEETHERLGDRRGVAGIQGEDIAVPVQREPHALELLVDDASVPVLPLPDSLHELLAAELLQGEAFLGELAFHDILRGDARAVCARL